LLLNQQLFNKQVVIKQDPNLLLMFYKLFIKRLLIICFFYLSASQMFGQHYSTTSNRAIKQFEEANRNYNLMYWDAAKSQLLKALRIDPEFIEAGMLLADVYQKLGEPQEAKKRYLSVIARDDEKYPEVYYFLGKLTFEEGNYTRALELFDEFLKKDTSRKRRQEDAVFFRESAAFAIQSISSPKPFSPLNLGTNINSQGNEFINAIRADDLELFYTGSKSDSGGGGDDFFVSRRESDEVPWPEGQRLQASINTPAQEGALSITPDGRFILFAGCQWPDGYGSCDIYAAPSSAGAFLEPTNLGAPVNTAAWESQPSFSSDGRTLFFASNRKDGYGKSDIWTSTLLDDGKWSPPQNLGATINTRGSEMSPFIHPDGRTLYFASDRHPGMGGVDLFLSRMDENNVWSDPVNLGFPINTSGDEINIIINTRGNKAYISSERHDGFGGYDIFEFELYDEIRPLPVTYIKGVITDAKTGQPLEAFFSLLDITSGREVVNATSEKKTGTFLVCVPAFKEYALNVSCEGYLFYSENISISGTHSEMKPKQVDIQLQPVEKGGKMVLRNIFFETGKYDIEAESEVELQRIVRFLEYYPSVKIEISGHTDTVGSAEYNLSLSQKRAKAVVDYLIANGIDPQRLSYQGYGFSRPVAGNATPENRAINRRTEIEIMDVGFD
jgi:outer membrane protein OmpA-like peptidoglycan-associated protein/tetratricopeptide (TPR) repeat protein